VGKTSDAVEHIKRALEVEGPTAKEHLKYALALAYRSNLQFDEANKAYLPIMKDEKTVYAYREMIDRKNKETLEQNLEGEIAGVCLAIDLYSHFQEMGYTKPKFAFETDMFQFYDPTEGWQFDRIPHAVDMLRNIRFFNRFKPEQLVYLLTKCTLRRTSKRSVLFFEKDEACILLRGNLQLLSHEENLAAPCLIATYHPGDIIGLDELDNGWCR
jgi:hypothetical protein